MNRIEDNLEFIEPVYEGFAAYVAKKRSLEIQMYELDRNSEPSFVTVYDTANKFLKPRGAL